MLARSPQDPLAGADSAEVRFDSWLAEFHGQPLSELDSACAEGTSPDRYSLFRDLDDDLWAILLTQQYESYPHIRALLPEMPDAALQELWNGRSGLSLAVQTTDFYAKVRAIHERHGTCGLDQAHVLDFGCGWGRITRYFARDVSPGRLFGCDPVEPVLEVCRATRVPGFFAQSDFLPDRLPFENLFDLVYAFSVFTHLSGPAHQRAMNAVHESLHPGGLLIMTVRPPAYLSSEAMRPLRDRVADGGSSVLAGPSYLFVPHPSNPWQPPPAADEDVVYGETVFTVDYLRRRWGSSFELVAADFLLTDPFQVVLTLKRV